MRLPIGSADLALLVGVLNPYSEAQFKTLKCCPAFPERFGSIADTWPFCDEFFDHYNHVHGDADIAAADARETGARSIV